SRLLVVAAVAGIRAQGPGWMLLRNQPALSSACAYDTGRQRLVMVDASVPSRTTTWEMDGADPAARWRLLDWPFVSSTRWVSMSYFEARGELVLVEGANTWCSSGNGWQRRLPAVSPPARERSTLCYDSARGLIVMFGGWSTATSTNLGDTWEWDGVTWHQV